MTRSMIRDASESGVPCLAEAMVRLQEAHVDAFPEIYRRFDVSEAAAHLTELLARPDTLVRVAEEGGDVFGHVVFVIVKKPESMFTHPQRYGLIAQIEVDPEFRRRGCGRSLLVDCEKLAASHDLERIVLDVWAFNDSAKSFFQSFGYDNFGSKMLRLV